MLHAYQTGHSKLSIQRSLLLQVKGLMVAERVPGASDLLIHMPPALWQPRRFEGVSG